MLRVWGLRLGPNFEVRLAAGKNFHLLLMVKKMHAFFRVSPSNIYDPAALATPVSRQPLTVQIQNEIQSENIDR